MCKGYHTGTLWRTPGSKLSRFRGPTIGNFENINLEILDLPSPKAVKPGSMGGGGCIYIYIYMDYIYIYIYFIYIYIYLKLG